MSEQLFELRHDYLTADQVEAFKFFGQILGLLNGEAEASFPPEGHADPCQIGKLASRIGDVMMCHDILSRKLNLPLTDWSAWMRPDQNPARRQRW